MSNTDDQGRADEPRDPTAPPAEPDAPPTAPPSYGQPQPPGLSPGQDTPYGQGYGAPYGQAYGAPYGQPADQGAPVPPAPGVPGTPAYPAAYQAPPTSYPGYAPPQQNTSALVLTIVSGGTLVFCGGLLVIPALIFGIMGLTKQSREPEESRRLSRNGWWAYGIGLAVTVVAAIVIFAVIIASSSSSYNGY